MRQYCKENMNNKSKAQEQVLICYLNDSQLSCHLIPCGEKILESQQTEKKPCPLCSGTFLVNVGMQLPEPSRMIRDTLTHVFCPTSSPKILLKILLLQPLKFIDMGFLDSITGNIPILLNHWIVPPTIINQRNILY